MKSRGRMSRDYLQLIQIFWDYLTMDAMSEFQQEQGALLSHVGLNNVVLKIHSLNSRRSAEYLKFPWRLQGARKISRENSVISKLNQKITSMPRILDVHVPYDDRNWRHAYLVTPAYQCVLKNRAIDEHLQRQMARVLLTIHREGTQLFSSTLGCLCRQGSPNKEAWLQDWAWRLKNNVPQGHWMRSYLNVDILIRLLRKRHLEWTSSPMTLCHGDAALRNWCRGEHDQFILIDWEDWTFGSVELDVAMLLVENGLDKDLLSGASWSYFLDEIFLAGTKWLTSLPFLVVLLFLLIQNWIWSNKYLRRMTEAPPALQSWFPYTPDETKQYLKWIESRIDYVGNLVLEIGHSR